MHWALHALGEEDEQASEALRSHQTSDGSWDENPYITAVSWMALEGSF
jgi:hypothetical protein